MVKVQYSVVYKRRVAITEEGSYILSGTLTDGQIIVAAKDAKVQLVLNNVDITCEDSAALYISDADKVFVNSLDGTTNSLSTTGEFVAIDDNNIDGAIYSKSEWFGEIIVCTTIKSCYSVIYF